MRNSALVSIVVPVYNNEEYLSRCIESILNQTYKNFELLLINDGSTDLSGEICEKYSKKDKRIKVIHQVNSGPSMARNRGIKESLGKYIQFVDSDDYINSNMTEGMVEAMNENVQLVFCGFNNISESNGKVMIESKKTPLQGTYCIMDFLAQFGNLMIEGFINTIWNKMYSAEVIKQNGFIFDDRIDLGEDLLFNLEYLKQCREVYFVEKQLYNYLIINKNSITGGFKKDYFENERMLFKKVRDYLIERNSFNGDNKYLTEVTYYNRIVRCLYNLFHKNSDLDSQNLKGEIRKIIFDKWVRENSNYFRKGNLITRFIGIFIKYKSTNGIYLLFKLKDFLFFNLYPVFKLLKIINTKIVREGS